MTEFQGKLTDENGNFFFTAERVKQAMNALQVGNGKNSPAGQIRLWSILKMLGMTADGDPVKVTTENNEDESRDLLELEALPKYAEEDGHSFYDPFVGMKLMEDSARSNIQTAIGKFADGQRGQADPRKWLQMDQDENDAWWVSLKDGWHEWLFQKEDGFAPNDEPLRFNLLDFAVWVFRTDGFDEKPTYDEIRGRLMKKMNLTQRELDLFFEEPTDEEAAVDGIFTDEPQKDEIAEHAQMISEGHISTDAATERSRSTLDKAQRKRLLNANRSVAGEDTARVDGSPRDKLIKEITEYETRAIRLVGPPGTGKTTLAFDVAEEVGARPPDELTIHKSISYGDFVERETVEGNGKFDFDYEKGRLWKAADRARDTDGLHFFILDEMNNANLRRVFGEAFTLIDHRGKAVSTAKSGREFSLPKNLVLLGTMNTIDRSTANIDFATKRRFTRIRMPPNNDEISKVVPESISAAEVKQLRILLSEVNNLGDFNIGHTYFSNLHGGLDDLNRVYERRIREHIEDSLTGSGEDTLSEVDALFEKATNHDLP